MAKRNINKTKLIYLILFSILFIYLTLYIFVFSKSLMNSDSAYMVEYSLEQIKTKTFLLHNWANTNDFWVYSLIPLITIFLKFGFSMFIARQAAVFIQTIAIFLIVFDLYKKEVKDTFGLIVVMLLMITGVSSNVMFEMYGDAAYGSIFFYMILILWLTIKYFRTKKITYPILIGLILTIITCFSLRFPIYIGAPIICVCVFLLFTETFDKKYVIIIGTVLLSCLIGYFGHNYLMNQYILVNMVKTGLVSNANELITNSQNSVFTYLWMCGATNINIKTLSMNYYYDINVFSPLIALSFVRLIFAVITLANGFMLRKHVSNMNEVDKTIYIFSCSLTILITYFLIFGQLSDWYRYMPPVIMSLLFLYPLSYKYIYKDSKATSIFYKLMIGAFALSAFVMVIPSFYDVEKKEFKENKMQDLADFLLDHGLTYGYTANVGNEYSLFNLLTDGKLKVLLIREDGTDPHYWLNSIDWYKPENHSGPVFVLQQEYRERVEYEAEADYHLTFDKWIIYVYDDINKVTDHFDTFRKAAYEEEQ